jgi:phospholipid/cholesterol/gamma-HCH transport system substrate-binding protein
MGTNVIETITGTIVLIIAGIFMWFAYTGSGLTQPKGYPLFAKFERVDGLNVGSDVKISGVKVGTVSNQYLDPQTFLAKVEFSVDSSVKVPVDSIAEIVSDGLMGGKYLALVPGGSDENIAAGGLVTHTQASVSLESMIGQLIFSKDDKKKEDGKEAPKSPQKESDGPRP